MKGESTTTETFGPLKTATRERFMARRRSKKRQAKKKKPHMSQATKMSVIT